MDESAAVRGGEPRDELQRDLRGPLQREGSPLERGAQRLAVEQFGHQIRLIAGADVEMARMFGCDRAATARASCSKR